MKQIAFILFFFLFTNSVNALENPSDGDSLIVSGKTVVIFGPSKPEYEALVNGGGKEVDSLLDEFYYQVSVTIPHLEQNGLTTKYSASDHIKVLLDNKKGINFERKKFDYIIGFILSDGKSEPVVVSGVIPPDSWLMKIVEYFNLK
ncbi:MAG TPA: hypothetical protein VGB89_15090 [Bacteroidota bacterium]|jgi:hypothetical protein